MEYLPGDAALDAAQAVFVAEPFYLARFGTGLGLLMPAQPHHSNAMLSGIGRPVAATVQPVMPSVTGAGLQRAGSADGSECCSRDESAQGYRHQIVLAASAASNTIRAVHLDEIGVQG